MLEIYQRFVLLCILTCLFTMGIVLRMFLLVWIVESQGLGNN